MQTDAKALPNPGAAHAVVVGGGTMGADVAVVLTRAACRTTVIESNAERAAGLPARVAENLKTIGREANAALLATAPSLDAVDWSTVDLVIECIPERLDIKQALFADLGAARPARRHPGQQQFQLPHQRHRPGPGYARPHAGPALLHARAPGAAGGSGAGPKPATTPARIR